MTGELPTSIDGGCLCEKVRYTITFPANHDFKRATSTCQCSQCRKQSGNLIYRAHKVPRGSVVYHAQSSLKLYKASKDASRGFCSECGSWLFWSADDEDKISFCVGTFDDDALRKYGKILTYAERHLYCVNEIPDVTDHLRGAKYEKDDE